jgi:hypothetical protein
MTTSTTYNLRDILGVELVDANDRDVAAVDRQLGPIRGPMPSDGPVVTVRFVDRLRTGRLRMTGVRESATDDHRLVILRSSHKVPARAAIPVFDLGASAEIVVEHHLPAVPLLVPILNLTALATGVVPLHAGAFVTEGRGVLVTGWAKGGKTETLLAFLRHGAAYVGDEWIYLRPNGTMDGIPEPIRLWHWHLDQLAETRRRLPAGDRAKLLGLRMAHAALGAAGKVARPARRARSMVGAQRHVDAPPHRIFDAAAIATGPIQIDTVVLVGSTDAERITVSEVDPVQVADRMVHSLAYERRELIARVYEARFGQPGRRLELLDRAEELERTGLRAMLGGRRALALTHPYPVEIDALHRALAPHLARS